MLEQAFHGTGFTLVQSSDIRQAMWNKLILNCTFNALSAISQKSLGAVEAEPELDDCMLHLIGECVAVAHAEGVNVDMSAERQLARIPRGQYTSMAHDLSLRRRTEIEQLNGVIVRRGQSHGIPTPANRAMLLLVRLIEARSPGLGRPG